MGLSERKPTNPKDALGIKRFAFSVIPMQVIAGIGLAMLEGALKYGRHNYRAIGVRSSVYFDAAMRHLVRFWEGEDIDPDSGLHHLDKALASIVVWRDAIYVGKLNDDRPPAVPEFATEFNKKAAELIEQFPDPVEPYTNENCP